MIWIFPLDITFARCATTEDFYMKEQVNERRNQLNLSISNCPCVLACSNLTALLKLKERSLLHNIVQHYSKVNLRHIGLAFISYVVKRTGV